MKSIKFGRCRWNSKKLRKNKKQTKKKNNKNTLSWTTQLCAVAERKKKRAMLVKKDGWLVTRGVRAGQRILRQWQTHKHTTTT